MPAPSFIQTFTGKLLGTQRSAGDAVDVSSLPTRAVLRLLSRGYVAAGSTSNALIYRGAWAATTAYAANDLVSYAGVAWRRVTAGTSGSTFSSANWEPLGDAYSGAGGDLLAVGQEVFSRSLATTNNQPLVNQKVQFTCFTARKSETVGQIRTLTGSTGAAATPTLCRLGLYTVDATSGDMTLVASTPNDTSLWAASGQAYTKSFSSPYAVSRGARYAVAFLCTTGVAAPNLLLRTPLQTASSAEAALLPRLCGALTGQTDLPSSATQAGLAVSTLIPYAALLP